MSVICRASKYVSTTVLYGLLLSCLSLYRHLADSISLTPCSACPNLPMAYSAWPLGGYALGTKAQPAQLILSLSPSPKSPSAFSFILLLFCSIMTHENTPLLLQNKNMHQVKHGLPTKTKTSYDCFTPGWKWMILALVSLFRMIPCMSIFCVACTYCPS